LLEGPHKKFFDSEVTPLLRHTKVGTVSMANEGENKNTSQVFLYEIFKRKI
jgi:cyclophilin family peptidyl-prolyl cis-trans isomerase